MNSRAPVAPRRLERTLFRWATTIDEAIIEVGRWAASLPGDFPVDAADRDDGVTEVRISGMLISSGVRLSSWIHLTEGHSQIEVRSYRFDVRDGASLVWRHDCHSGHEDEPNMTGPEHQHVRVGRTERRIPARPQTLETLRVLLVKTNMQHAIQP
jgi:hypothetical protein